MEFKKYFLIALLSSINLALGQDGYKNPVKKDSIQRQFFVIDNDTMFVNEIKLDEIIVFQPLKFESKNDMRKYLILRRKTRKVWPYATLAADRLEKLNARLDALESKRKRKKYTKRVQKYIEQKFTDQLKKLTKTEGQILVKLIHRQTGMTTFDMVKDLKSGWRAFWYNTTASLFNISLKEEYRPYQIKEDYLIEDILQRAFKDGILDNPKPEFEIDYLDLVEHWNLQAKENPEIK